MIKHKVSPEVATEWGIVIKDKDGAVVDVVEIDPEAETAVLHDGTEVKLADYDVDGLARYKLMIGF